MTANLGLAGSLARQWRGGIYADKYQESCLALMRAVELFDPGRGVQFSTYACNAIWRRLIYLRNREASALTPCAPNSNAGPAARPNPSMAALESDGATARLAGMIAELRFDQRLIIRLHFGLDGKPWTLGEIGRKLGITKERVRQLEAGALDALRIVEGVEITGTSGKAAKRYPKRRSKSRARSQP